MEQTESQTRPNIYGRADVSHQLGENKGEYLYEFGAGENFK